MSVRGLISGGAETSLGTKGQLIHERLTPSPASPATETEKILLGAVNKISHRVTKGFATLNQKMATLEQKLDKLKDRVGSLEEREAGAEATNSSVEERKRKRWAHNPKIAGAVRCLHNSECNSRRYKPEDGLSSPNNEAITSHLVASLIANPEMQNVEKDAIISACKTCYEMVRSSKPELADQAIAMKTSAWIRQKRNRLLEVRRSVLKAEDMEFWRGITADMMSNEEAGTFEGVSGWIMWPPSFRSQELSELCATLQARLAADPRLPTTDGILTECHYSPMTQRLHTDILTLLSYPTSVFKLFIFLYTVLLFFHANKVF